MNIRRVSAQAIHRVNKTTDTSRMWVPVVVIGSLLLSACSSVTGKGGPSFDTIAQPYQMAADAKKSGAPVYNACRLLPVHQAPSGLSRADRVLKFGASVRVLELAGYFKPVAVGEADAAQDDSKKIAAWVKMESGNVKGFVSTRCLVTKKLLERQNPATSKKKARSQDVASAKRGFSEEEEDVDMSAMRGAAGSAKGGKANHAKIDRILLRYRAGNPHKSLMTFRSRGKLGEFAK